jgi:hypothetical protein
VKVFCGGDGNVSEVPQIDGAGVGSTDGMLPLAWLGGKGRNTHVDCVKNRRCQSI